MHWVQIPTGLQNKPNAQGAEVEQALFSKVPLQVTLPELESQVKSSRATLAPDPQELSPTVQVVPIGIATAR
jgi:hypothetical protein